MGVHSKYDNPHAISQNVSKRINEKSWGLTPNRSIEAARQGIVSGTATPHKVEQSDLAGEFANLLFGSDATSTEPPVQLKVEDSKVCSRPDWYGTTSTFMPLKEQEEKNFSGNKGSNASFSLQNSEWGQASVQVETNDSGRVLVRMKFDRLPIDVSRKQVEVIVSRLLSKNLGKSVEVVIG